MVWVHWVVYNMPPDTKSLPENVGKTGLPQRMAAVDFSTRGKPRFDGVRDFVTSRGIQLPEGSPNDPPQLDTVGGLGNRKNDLVNQVIHERGGWSLTREA